MELFKKIRLIHLAIAFVSIEFILFGINFIGLSIFQADKLFIALFVLLIFWGIPLLLYSIFKWVTQIEDRPYYLKPVLILILGVALPIAIIFSALSNIH